MTEQFKSLIFGPSSICFLGWIILGIMQQSPFLIISSMLVSFFVLVARMGPYAACGTALVTSIVLNILM